MPGLYSLRFGAADHLRFRRGVCLNLSLAAYQRSGAVPLYPSLLRCQTQLPWPFLWALGILVRSLVWRLDQLF